MGGKFDERGGQREPPPGRKRQGINDLCRAMKQVEDATSLEREAPRELGISRRRMELNKLFFANAKKIDAALGDLDRDEVPAALHNILVVIEGSVFREEGVRGECTYPVFEERDGKPILVETRTFVRLVVDDAGRIVGCLNGRVASCTNAASIPDYYAAPDGYQYIEATLICPFGQPARIYLWNLGEREPSDFKNYIKNAPGPLRPVDGLLIWSGNKEECCQRLEDGKEKTGKRA